MNLDGKKYFVFDLDDTLSESKSNLKESMANLLLRILLSGKGWQIGIISGCSHEQMMYQFLNPLKSYFFKNFADVSHINEVLPFLYLMPASGSQLYHYDSSFSDWRCAYKESLALRDKVNIYNCFYESCNAVGVLPAEEPYGEIAEDRDSQITFSFLGQQAPLDVKKSWDSDGQKRLRVATRMSEIFRQKEMSDTYTMTVGGSSSIDVTLAGRDKSYGMSKFLDWRGNIHSPKRPASKEEVIFVADAIFPGGNDYSVKEMGIYCVLVKSPEQTERFLKYVLGDIKDATI